MAYANWAALVAAESTANYAVVKSDQRSQWAMLAIHGDQLERLTTDIVTDVANANRYTRYALNLHDTTVPADNQRMRIIATNFDEPQCVAIQNNASYTLAVHAISDVAELPGDLGKIRIRGVDGTRQTRLTEILTDAGFAVVNKCEEGVATLGERGDALDPNNIVNKNRNTAGVNMELDLTFRKTLVTNPADLSSPKSALYTTFINALAAYFATYNKYNRWADLAAIEVEGTDYDIETVTNSSRWTHIAIHGGGMELMTTSLARAVAEAETQRYWSLIATKGANDVDLSITGTRFDNPACVALVGGASFCISYHGMSNATAGTTSPVAEVSGLDTYNRDRIINALVDAGFNAIVATHGENSTGDVNNIVNKTSSGAGVQIDMNRALRDSFLVSGNAADEGTSATTTIFDDFVAAIASVTHQEPVEVGNRPFDVGEFGTLALTQEVTLTHNRAHQQACQDAGSGTTFFTQLISDGVQLADEGAAPPDGTRAARGDICINRVSNTGVLLDRMWCRGFDHGASLGGVEFEGGSFYLWLATDATEQAIGTNAYGDKICKIQYVANKIYDKGDLDIDIYDVFPSGSERLAPCMDFASNRVGVFRRQGGVDSYRVYDMTAFRAKNFSAPFWPVNNVANPEVRQAWCIYQEYVYAIYGEAWGDGNPPPPTGVGNTHMTIIHLPTGQLMEDHIRNTEMALENREPESLNIWDQHTEPKLMYGWSVSDTLPRRCRLQTISARWPYRNWQEVVENEETTAYEVHQTDRGSEVSHLAIHGEAQEAMTMYMAQEIAQLNEQEFFAVEGKKGSTPPDNNNLLRIPSTLFDQTDCVALQNRVAYSWSYHGRATDLGDPAGGVVYVGGLDAWNRQRTAVALEAAGFNVIEGGREGGGFGDQGNAANIVNRSVTGAGLFASGLRGAVPMALANGGGVQLELSRALRNSMSASGDAGDLTEGTTSIFTDFVNAVSSVVSDPSGNEVEAPEDKCVRYFINDYNLDQPSRGIKLMEGSEWASPVSPRRFNLEIPQFHGEVAMWHDPLDTMKVTLQVQISARTQSVLRQRWDDFVSLCGTGKWIPIRLERYRGIFLISDTEHDPLDNNRPFGEYANAQLESMTAPEYEHASLRLTTTCIFNVPVGQWRSHKVYTQAYEGPGGPFKAIVAKTSSVPVYSMIIRVQGGPGLDRNLASWSIIDRWSQTGIGWDDPVGVNLNNGEWLYCNTDNMRAYISSAQTMPEVGEDWSDFVDRINGVAAWSNFRYLRNGPLMLTHKLEWNETSQSLTHTSGVNIEMIAIDGDPVDRELVIQARSAHR